MASSTLLIYVRGGGALASFMNRKVYPIFLGCFLSAKSDIFGLYEILIFLEHPGESERNKLIKHDV